MRTFSIVPASRSVLTAEYVVSLSKCGFRPRIKAGMSRAQANDAIDTAFDDLITCMQNKGRKPKSSTLTSRTVS